MTDSPTRQASQRKIRVAVIIINRDRPEITDKVVEQTRDMGKGLDKQLFVVECGSKPQGRSKYATHWFRDRNYKWRYYGFNQGLNIARKSGDWDYFWFVVNDIYFPDDQDTLRILVDTMEQVPGMALIGPGEPEGKYYRGCEPKPGRLWHKAATVHGLACLMRAQAIDEVGYCNPKFHYSQGAGSELSYLLYKNGWFMAYSDVAVLYHDQNGSTYGVVTKISRHEYHRRARRFASRYLARHYGETGMRYSQRYYLRTLNTMPFRGRNPSGINNCRANGASSHCESWGAESHRPC
jgi:hypothetical protein